jgi:hypothetical protein
MDRCQIPLTSNVLEGFQGLGLRSRTRTEFTMALPGRGEFPSAGTKGCGMGWWPVGVWHGCCSPKNAMRRSKQKLIDGWQIRSRFDWFFTGVSFLAFLCLEATLLYAYFSWLNHLK